MRFVISLPLGTAAVVVVCEDLVIVNVTTGEQRAPARTAHGSGHVRVSQLGALVPYSLQSPWHEVQRTYNGYETIHFGYGQTSARLLCIRNLCTPKRSPLFRNRLINCRYNMLFIMLNANYWCLLHGIYGFHLWII